MILPQNWRSVKRSEKVLELESPTDAAGGTRRFMAMDKGLQGAIAAKLLNEREEVEEKICLGVYLCEECGKLHFLEAPAELQ